MRTTSFLSSILLALLVLCGSLCPDAGCQTSGQDDDQYVQSTWTTRNALPQNSDGVGNEPGAAPDLRLSPHFYQTRFFYLLVALVVVLAGLGIYRLRVRHLIYRTNELEGKVAVRTAEVVAQSKEMTQLNDQLRE